MNDLPIIMSGPMVLATLREIAVPGTGKTETRRLAWKPSKRQIGVLTDPKDRFEKPSPWQNAKIGDRLWVRESLYREPSPVGWRYAADKDVITLWPNDPRVSAMIAWAHHYERDTAPSIHMPRWASRLTLIVTAVKIERLQAISERDALAEGVTKVRDSCYVVKGFDYDKAGLCHSRAVIPFSKLWDSLHGDGAWDANPEVVAVTFRPFLSNIDAMPRSEAA